jgi:hypothetical protein
MWNTCGNAGLVLCLWLIRLGLSLEYITHPTDTPLLPHHYPRSFSNLSCSFIITIIASVERRPRHSSKTIANVKTPSRTKIKATGFFFRGTSTLSFPVIRSG